MTTRATAGTGESAQITAKELQESEDILKWYDLEIKIPAVARALLEQYSGFATDEIGPHVETLVCANHLRIHWLF